MRLSSLPHAFGSLPTEHGLWLTASHAYDLRRRQRRGWWGRRELEPAKATG